MPLNPTLTSDWPEAIATVLECRYDMRAGRALIGIPSGKRFRIRYNYFANGDTHEGELFSATAIPQNTLFPIRYNPDLPTDHTHDHPTTTPNPRNAILIIGIVGSVILSLAWLFVLRGCN